MYAILFDIDGTLIQTAGAGRLAFATTFSELFSVQEISSDVPFAGRSDRAIALDLMRVHGVDPTEDHWLQFVESYLRNLEISLPECAGEVLPGVSRLLEGLCSLDHALVGLLTGNIQRGAQRKLSHYGLADRFPFGGFGDQATDRNVIASQALEEALVLAQGKLKEVMVIGDTIHDIRCARSIGACAVAVPTGNTPAFELHEEKPDIFIEDLTDAEPLLNRINR